MIKGVGWHIMFLASILLSAFGCEGRGPVVDSNSQVPLCIGKLQLSDLENLVPPTKRTNIGNAHLNIATSSATAQKWFDQGLNLLHGFWHLEAYRAFQQVIKIDPNCSMGYWGIAMCQAGFGGDITPWQEAIRKAIELGKQVTPLERRLIKSTGVLLHEGVEAAIPHFTTTLELFPNNPELIALTSLFQRQAAKDEQQIKLVKSQLEAAIVRFPDHAGLRHYYVHLMEVGPDYMEAQPSAHKMIELAPEIPHLLHMPGHLHFLAGDYSLAAQAFERAKIAEEAYHTAEKISPAVDQNYLHNLQFLAATYAELNEYEHAFSTAEAYAKLALKTGGGSNSSDLLLNYKGRIMPALVNMRFCKYKAATSNLDFWLSAMDPPIHDPLTINYLKGMREYCIGMRAVRAGKEEVAIRASKSMKGYVAAYKTAVGTERNGEEMRHINENYDLLMMSWYQLVGWGVNMDATKEFIADPWEKAFALEAALGYAEPPRLLYPVGESLMRLRLQRQEEEAAKAASIQALKERPQSPIIKAVFAAAIDKI